MILLKYKTTFIQVLIFGLFLTMVNPFNVQAATSLPPGKYSIDLDFTITGQSMGFLFGATSTGNLYMWQLNCQTTNHFRLRPHIMRNGNWAYNTDVDVSNVITNATKNAPHHMKIEVNSDTLNTYLDGTLVDTRIDKEYLKGKYGRVGMRASPTASDNEGGVIDNLVIKDGDGNTLYSNDFEVSAQDFPECDIFGGKLKLKAGMEFALKNGMWTTNYTIETDITARNMSVSFMFSAIDKDNLYMWQYNIEQAHARLRTHKRLNGSWILQEETDLNAIIPDNQKTAEHHMKIEVKGTTITTWFDGVKANDIVLEELGYGQFGFRYGGEDGSFDNLVIKDDTGKKLYANDFNHNPPYNFPKCISVDGKLRNGSQTTEFELNTPSDKIHVGEILAPKTQKGKLGDTIAIELTSFTDYNQNNLPIHYQVNGGIVYDGIIGSLPAFGSVKYTFPQKYNFSRHYPDIDTVTVWTAYDTFKYYAVNFFTVSDFSLNFTGSDNKQAKIENTPSINPDHFTVQAWVYPVAFKTNVYEGHVISNQTDVYSGYALKVGNADGDIGFSVGTSSGWEGAIAGPNSLVLNQWQHIAGVFSGDSVKIYVNGKLKGAKKVSGAMKKSTNPLLIGSCPAWEGSEFNGMVDEVGIWNVALTDKQVSSTSKIHLVGNEPGLEAYYRLNEGPGTSVVVDATGHGHTGTLFNFVEQYNIWGSGKMLPLRVLETPASLNVAATEGSMASFQIHSNANWNVSNLPVWLSANLTNGAKDSLLITLTATKNTLSKTKSASISISDGFIEKSILITQAAAEPELIVPSSIGLDQPQNSKYKFAIISNSTWNITDLATWLKVDKTSGTGTDSLTFEALSANNSPDPRQDTVWVSDDNLKRKIILIQLGTSPGLLVNTSDILTPYASKTHKISITTNRSWSVKSVSNPSWLSVSAAAGMKSADITLNVTANKTGFSRKDTITFEADVLIRKLVITQDSAILNIPETLSIGNAEASFQDFDITSNIVWTIEDESWLSANVSGKRGEGSRNIRLTALQNPKDIARVAKVYFSSVDFDILDSITITQQAAVSYMKVDSTVIHFGASSKLTNSFEVNTNSHHWTATTKAPTWFTIAKSALNTIVLTATENISFISRVDTIFINGSLNDTVVVKQGTATPTLNVSSLSQAYIDAAADSKATFQIKSNVFWSVKGLSSWLSADKTNGTGSATITLTAQPNILNTTRKDTLIIEGSDGVVDQMIIVLQTRAGTNTSVKEVVSEGLLLLYPNPTNGFFQIEFSNSLTFADVQIFNTQGVLLKAVSLHQKTTMVDISDLANGIYMVKVTCGKWTEMQKIIKR